METLERKSRMYDCYKLGEEGKTRPIGRKSILTAQVGSLRREKSSKWLQVNVWKL